MNQDVVYVEKKKLMDAMSSRGGAVFAASLWLDALYISTYGMYLYMVSTYNITILGAVRTTYT
jgi:hypothetical protein